MASSDSPTVLVGLSIDPPRFHVGDGGPSPEAPSITLTVTSQAALPITIFTWPTIFNLRLAQRRKNFICQDLTTDKSVLLEITKGPKRPGFSRTSSGLDDAHFHTLEPGETLPITAPFALASRKTNDSSSVLVPGHRYRLGIDSKEKISWWRYGRKEEVMAPEGEAASLGEASGPPISLEDIDAVEFEVLGEAC